jgi:hypothetical protein
VIFDGSRRIRFEVYEEIEIVDAASAIARGCLCRLEIVDDQLFGTPPKPEGVSQTTHEAGDWS